MILLAAAFALLVVLVGALMRYAVTSYTSHGFNWHEAGLILMIVGGVAFFLALLFSGVYSHRRTRRVRSDGTIVDDEKGIG